MLPLIFGCDFTSSPNARKPIVVAIGAHAQGRVTLSELMGFESLDAWGDWLLRTPAWIGAFDFPFGLPRELVEKLGWPTRWRELMSHYASLQRSEIRSIFSAFCAARPIGGKFAHRATDLPAGSSPSMKWVNPPVAYMMHAGVPRLLAAGASLPGLHDAGPDCRRIALEGYPGLLARELIGRRSYKSDDRKGQTEARYEARAELLRRLASGTSRLAQTLDLGLSQSAQLQSDGSGDRLDAVLCLIQACWAAQRADCGWGLPVQIDPVEGAILTV